MVSAEGVCAAYFRYRRSPDNANTNNTQTASALTVLPTPVVPGA